MDGTCTYLFVLCDLNPDYAIINLNTFLPLSCLLLLLACWWLSYSYRCFPPLWKGQNVCAHFQEYHISMIHKNAWHWNLKSNFLDNGTATIKLEMSWRKWDIWDIRLYYTKQKKATTQSYTLNMSMVLSKIKST